MNILLTTHPAHKSQNVGDSLITDAYLSLINKGVKSYQPEILFREESLDKYKETKITSIVAPGFSVSNNVYPDLFKLYENLSNLPVFLPFGCSYQSATPDKEAFIEEPYNEKTRKFLNYLVDKTGPFPCRDDMIVERLNYFNIPAYYCGDIALFRENKINEEFIYPETIRSVVVTIQHHLKYTDQSLKLLNLIKKKYPEAQLYVSLHSLPGKVPQSIALKAEQIGYKILNLYGQSSNLKIYEEIDLHVGYRLHGHISFLRNRKPSILLVEDPRAFGFSQTEGTRHGCFNAFKSDDYEADYTVLDDIMNFLDQSVETKYSGYDKVFEFIDCTFNQVVKPYFDDFRLNILN